jgi:hypothetical protein
MMVTSEVPNSNARVEQLNLDNTQTTIINEDGPKKVRVKKPKKSRKVKG